MARNLADLFEAVAAEVGEREAVVCGEDRRTYAELDARADRLAEHLTTAGLEVGAHVGIHMRNGVEFVEGLLGCLKARMVPININYRYTDAELAYLYDNADLAGLIVGTDYEAAAARVAGDVATLAHTLVVGGEPSADWPARVTARGYEDALASASGEWQRPQRSDDDHYILYTGGTTGDPKGVIWRHEDMYYAALGGGDAMSEDTHDTPEALATATSESTPLTYLLVPPLMHGAGSYLLFTALFMGAKVVLVEQFDPDRVLRLVSQEQAMILVVVGDAMARPIVDALDAAEDGTYDLSTLFVLGSGGALLAASTREGLLRHKPDLFIRDSFGSSETGSDGQVEIAEDGTLRLSPEPHRMVVDDRLRPIEPGSGRQGYVARRGNVPLGYYKDEDKTAKTFPVIDGERWAVVGDIAHVEADGTVMVHGRGSGVINSGGEKVFPEEVEGVLKSHPAVMDALVAGVADERFGERVGAVVEPREGAEIDVDELRAHCRERLAGYKVPAAVEVVDQIRRTPAGKANYRWAKETLAGQPA